MIPTFQNSVFLFIFIFSIFMTKTALQYTNQIPRKISIIFAALYLITGIASAIEIYKPWSGQSWLSFLGVMAIIVVIESKSLKHNQSK